MAPLLNVSITGMVFFQGESDSINSDDYGEALIAYVNDLREKFGSNFMFINMQLTSYGYESGGVQLTGIWDCVPDMRYAQSELKMDGSISNYEVITTLDAGWRDGDGDGAHPYYKKVIAQRAAALAAAKIYNIGDINSSGCPVPSKIEYNRKEIVITYDYYGSSLQTQGGGDVTGFEVKQGGEWKAVDKAVIDGNKITISGLDNPEGVRYAPELRYTSTDNANVCSSSGYPAAAFSAEFA